MIPKISNEEKTQIIEIFKSQVMQEVFQEALDHHIWTPTQKSRQRE
jgi:hypothetical protein